jgi:pimeloyl-ACP methyl ester carboxylesterase
MENKPHWASATSIDGTKLSYLVTGSGPGLVIVHGNASSSDDFAPFAEYLADSFTLFILDRRGRGQSGPQGPDYSLKKETEDVRAVLSATNSAYLFGHSYGALIAIETATSYPLAKLVLYEPPTDVGPLIEGFLPAFIQALGEKDYVRAYMALVGGLDLMPDMAKFEWYVENVIKADPHGWSRLIEVLNATEKEAREALRYELPDSEGSLSAADTVLLLGEVSPPFIQTSATKLVDRFPGTRIVPLPGQGHAAQATGPDLLARAIKNFLAD